ncbi:MAG TPA: hypothetical protein VI757_01815 [Bacteroidia bacterium]|nr:hypothetical protein [Bacteroidia bacterium]
MRKLFCLLFCLQSFIGIAQNDSLNKWRKSVAVDFSISGNNYGLNIAPGYCLENNKNHFMLAPLLLSNDNLSRYKLTGIRINYAFYPGTRQKVLDFYFNYDFLLQSIVSNVYFFNSNTNDLKENVLTTFENYIGYGFKIKILHHLYITHGIGIGWVIVHSKYSKETNYFVGEDESDRASGIIKIGFEYYFHK